MPPHSDSVELLLVHADTHTPVLEEGLPAGANPDAQSGKTDAHEPDHFWEEGGDPNDLEAQRWGLLLPAGPTGDRLRALIQPLVALRREQQGGHPIQEYRVPAGPMTLAEAALWRKKHFDSGEGLNADVPRYQLVLGDFDQVPLAVQQIQAADGYVGRLHFSDERGYAAYVEKVLRAEKQPRQGLGRLLVHTAHDGSSALNAGFNALISPGVELMKIGQGQGSFPPSALQVYGKEREPGLDAFLEGSVLDTPGVLFSMSHGVGAPRGGWAREADRLEGQGAMSFGLEGPLRASELASRPFMPNGVWFMFACFGAGTPNVSAYSHWLKHLVDAGRYSRLPDVLQTLAAAGRPFVAATPQTVLANPNGPLAFIGHVDLAWTFGFREDDSPAKKRPGRFIEPLKSLLNSNRVGIGFRELYRHLALTDTELSSLHDDDVRTRAATSNEERVRRGCLWMMRQDIAGYVLLGDPAVRLPVEGKRSRAAAGVTPVFTPPAFAPPAVPMKLPIAAERLEEAIGYMLTGERSMKELATEYGIERRELERLADLYCKAGRAALGLPA